MALQGVVDWLSSAWTVLTAIGVGGAVSAWVGGYFGDVLPPFPRVVRAISNVSQSWLGETPVANDDGRYHLVLCALDGDDAKEGTPRLLRTALNPQDYPILRVTVSARCIRMAKWYERKDLSAGSSQADRVLRSHSAHVVLWGEVPKQGEGLRFFLRGVERQEEPQTIPFDKGLAKERPDSALGPALAAALLAQLEAFYQKAGQKRLGSLRNL